MMLFRRIKELKVDVLINLCEGFLGRPQLEANVAAMFEAFGVPYTGSPSKALAICQDKFKAKAVLNAFGLPTPKGRLATSTDQKIEVPFPAIVKPNSEDASLGIYPGSVVHDQAALMDRVTNIIDGYKQPALVEEFIEGREFNVAVLETDKLQALPVSEIDFSAMPEIGAAHLQLRGQMVRGPRRSTPPRRPSARRRSTIRCARSCRITPWPPSRRWAAAITPGSISGWVRTDGWPFSRSTPTRHQPRRRLLPGAPGRGHRATPSSGTR